MGNPYLIQHIKTNTNQILNMREAEVETLRKILFETRNEACELRYKNKQLEAHLYRLAQAVLAGETEIAQEIAQKSLILLGGA